MTPKISALYRPLQPTLNPRDTSVSYVEMKPDPRLQPFIYCYWELKTTETLTSPFHYRVVADGCLDIYFDLNDPAENYVMGFCRQYTEFPLPEAFHYVGIRFLPAMLPLLFRIDASELTNRFEKLAHVIPSASSFIAQTFRPEVTSPQIKTLLDRYFLKHLMHTDVSADHRVSDAIAVILENKGMVALDKGLGTGLSPRQLRRLFSWYIGESPKPFSQVVRFQNLLSAGGSTRKFPSEKAFYDAGYYDQAHFIKEFRTFYGATPGQVYGK